MDLVKVHRPEYMESDVNNQSFLFSTKILMKRSQKEHQGEENPKTQSNKHLWTHNVIHTLLK